MTDIEWANYAIDNAYKAMRNLEEQYNELGSGRRFNEAKARGIYQTAAYYGARASVANAVLERAKR